MENEWLVNIFINNFVYVELDFLKQIERFV